MKCLLTRVKQSHRLITSTMWLSQLNCKNFQNDIILELHLLTVACVFLA